MIYLLTVHGIDRVGLVELMADHIQDHGGNWLESRLCRLGGQFAGIVRVEFTAEPTRLAKSIGSLSCEWVLLSESDLAAANAERRITIDITAADRPGLVKQIAHIVASNGANIENVESSVFSAPFSGEQMFKARYQVSVSCVQAQEALLSQLEALAEELVCDILACAQPESATSSLEAVRI